jgi:hypothetical protein
MKNILRTAAVVLGTAILFSASALSASAQQFGPAIGPPPGFVPTAPTRFPPITIPVAPPGWVGTAPLPGIYVTGPLQAPGYRPGQPSIPQGVSGIYVTKPLQAPGYRPGQPVIPQGVSGIYVTAPTQGSFPRLVSPWTPTHPQPRPIVDPAGN